MGKKVQLNILVDEELKKRFEAWCEERGFSVSSVLAFFMRLAVDGKIEIGLIKKD